MSLEREYTITHPLNRDVGARCTCRPFYDKITIDLPGAPKPLVITSTGAPSRPYIKSVTVNGRSLDTPILTHEDIVAGGHIVFEMSDTPQAWVSRTALDE